MQQLFVAETQIPHILPLLGASSYTGHFVIEKPHHRTQERFFWAGMKRDVQNWAGSSDQCLRRKGMLQSIYTVSQLGSLVTLSAKYR